MDFEQITDKEKEALHIADVVCSLRNDPNADDSTKNYEELEEYLKEVIQKDGSLMFGVICALEEYLDK